MKRCLPSIRVHTLSTSFNIEDICLVINKSGKDIKVDEFTEAFGAEQPAKSFVKEGKPISKEGYIKIKPSKLRKEGSIPSSNIRPYMRVSLMGDIRNNAGVELSMNEIQTNIAFIISMGKNNQLVKESFSKEEIKGKKITSEEELKNLVMSIVEKIRNDSSGHGVQNSASAERSQKEKEKNLGRGKGKMKTSKT